MEERDLNVSGEDVIAKEPAPAFDAVERRVPPDRFAHVRYSANDKVVESAPKIVFPTRHGGDVGLDGGVAVAFRNLGVAAGEEHGFCLEGLCDLR